MSHSDRPHMPGYGLKPPQPEAGLLPWSFVQEEMAAARNYWLATVTREGKPHTAPLWGIWYQYSFYFSTGAKSRKGRNLKENPYVVVHLESGDEAVILEGQVHSIPQSALFDELSRAYHQKYGVHLTVENPVFGLVIEKVFAWREHDFPTSATRWQFGTSGQEDK